MDKAVVEVEWNIKTKPCHKYIIIIIIIIITEIFKVA